MYLHLLVVRAFNRPVFRFVAVVDWVRNVGWGCLRIGC